jgi:hypothetical protein
MAIMDAIIRDQKETEMSKELIMEIESEIDRGMTDAKGRLAPPRVLGLVTH